MKSFKLGKMEIDFWKGYNFDLSFSKCSYFDARPTIQISLYFFTCVIHLPWYNKGWEDECDPPKYGIAIHGNTFWIYTGGKGNMNGGNTFWAWDIPFWTNNLYKHYVFGKNEEWIDITHKYVGTPDYQKFIDEVGYMTYDLDENKTSSKIFHGKWLDDYDNSIIDAKYRIEKMIWRPKWLRWTSLFEKTRKYIEVAFKDEVGSRKGSWKGGTIGASNDFKDETETPEECFARMNKEKKW